MRKKIISVTPIYNNEFYIRPHFKMLSKYVDKMVVLLGDAPFPEYAEAFGISSVPDKSRELLKEFDVHIFPQADTSFGGKLLNDGLDKVRELGGDVMLKLDVDMFLTDKDFQILVDYIQNTDFDSILLDFYNNTFVYKGDLDHGVPCKIFPVGSDPIAIHVRDSFFGDKNKWGTTGENKVIFTHPDLMIHHLTGFFRTDKAELKRCESLTGFPGWASAPDEIKQMFV